MHHKTEIDAQRSIYSAQAAILVEVRVTNALLKDVLEALHHRAPAPSLHDIVAEATGSHRALTRTSTPPLLALAQKGWWKVSMWGLGLLASGAAGMLLNEFLHKVR